MTDNLNFETQNKYIASPKAGGVARNSRFERYRARFFAMVFNGLHRDMKLYQNHDRTFWILCASEFSLQINEKFIFKALAAIFAKNPDEIIADGYVNGDWLIQNGHLDQVLGSLWERQTKSNRFLKHFRYLLNMRRFGKSQMNSPTISKGNIKEHYDAENPDNILFEQMLGTTACYSSALFDELHGDLDSAQQNKLCIIRDKMRLKEGARVLDIGSGWGELTERFVDAGCDTTGITVSHNQLAYCRERYKEKIASGKLHFEFNDYRDFFAASTEKFDSISCIEVLDHIGLAHFDGFFEKVSDNLSDDGVFILQVITRPKPGQTSSWIDKHIYPGGYIASLEEIEAAYTRAGFECLETENFSGTHYAKTLREWRILFETFQSNRKNDPLFPEKFFRKWEFFLSSSIVAFEKMGFANSHISLGKPIKG